MAYHTIESHIDTISVLAGLEKDMKRVLVTGAPGFIGRQSLLPLLERDYEVHALYMKEPIESDARIIWHKANLLEKSSALNLCATIQATHLLHFAWYVHPQDYKTSSLNSLWKDATLSLLEAFQKNGGIRAVLAGTNMEYDFNTPQGVFQEYMSPIAPATIYGKAKNETRILAEEFAGANDLSLAWGRIFNLYGPHEAPTRLMPQIIFSLLDGKTPQITSGGLIRDYTFVKDTAGAFVSLLDSNVTGIVNIASGKPLTLKNIALSTAEILGASDLVEPIAETIPENEPARIVADVTRLTKEVDWVPRYDLRTGLEESIAWWRINPR